MGFCEVLHDCEAEARAPDLARPSCIDTIEALENARQVLARDPDARVTDAHYRAMIFPLGEHRNASSRGISHRILDEILQDLSHCVGSAMARDAPFEMAV